MSHKNTSLFIQRHSNKIDATFITQLIIQVLFFKAKKQKQTFDCAIYSCEHILDIATLGVNPPTFVNTQYNDLKLLQMEHK